MNTNRLLLDELNTNPFYFLLILMIIFASYKVLVYILHNIRKQHYFKQRQYIFAQKKEKYKIEKIFKKLEKIDDYSKLPTRYKNRLYKYLRFVVHDLKYQVFCENYRFRKRKKVKKMIIEYKGSLGNAKGTPKKVFTKLSKNSRRRSGYLSNILLFESIVFDKEIYGIRTKDGYIKFSYELTWKDKKMK